MFDLTNYKKKYLEMKLREGQLIYIETPTKRDLQKIMKVASDAQKGEYTDTIIDDIFEALLLILNKNKDRVTVTKTEVDELFTFDIMMAFFNEFFEWITENASQKN